MEAFLLHAERRWTRQDYGEIPASIAQQAKEAHEALVELVAEGKDELMEEFFARGDHPRAAPY